MIRAKNYETCVLNLSKLCLEYCGLLFSRHGIYQYTDKFPAMTAKYTNEKELTMGQYDVHLMHTCNCFDTLTNNCIRCNFPD